MQIICNSRLQVRTKSTVERLVVLDLLLFLLAKYSSKENSQVVASKKRLPGDLLPEKARGNRIWYRSLFTLNIPEYLAG